MVSLFLRMVSPKRKVCIQPKTNIHFTPGNPFTGQNGQLTLLRHLGEKYIYITGCVYI